MGEGEGDGEVEGEVLHWVSALEISLLPCLPARELQATDRSAHPSHQADVERHVKDFMEAARKLQLFFIRIQHQHEPGREETLLKEIAALEEELKEKNGLLEKQRKLLIGWQDLFKKQKSEHIAELERV